MQPGARLAEAFREAEINILKEEKDVLIAEYASRSRGCLTS